MVTFNLNLKKAVALPVLAICLLSSTNSFSFTPDLRGSVIEYVLKLINMRDAAQKNTDRPVKKTQAPATMPSIEKQSIQATVDHRQIIHALSEYARVAHQNIEAFFNPNDSRKLPEFAHEVKNALDHLDAEVIAKIPHNTNDYLLKTLKELAHDLKTIQGALYDKISQRYSSSATLLPALLKLDNDAQLKNILNEIKTIRIATIKRLCPDAASLCNAIHNLVNFKPGKFAAFSAISKRV